MSIDRLINTNLLRAYAAGAVSEQELASLDRLNEWLQDLLLDRPRHPPRESRSEELVRRLTVAADELRRLGAWLASHAFPLVELLGEDTEEDRFYAYREDHGRRFGEHLLALTARFQESLHPTAEEVRAWRRAHPDHVPYWRRPEPLAYPPPARPTARDGGELIRASVASDLAHLEELLRQAARHYEWMVTDLAQERPEADVGRETARALATELGRLRDRLSDLAADVCRLAGVMSSGEGAADG